MRVRMGKFLSIAVAAGAMVAAAQPAYANSKDRGKRSDTLAAGCTDACKPGIRSMSESTPSRKTDCPRTRRILM